MPKSNINYQQSSIKNSNLKVAIVCDWLTGIGGAERVVLEIHRMYPDAPIYTSQYDPLSIDWFKDADIRTTWLQKLPKSLKKFLPMLRAWTFSRLDLSDYDLVISSSGAEAKGIKTNPNTVHVCYCHAPTHYYWSRYEDYLKNPGFGSFDWLARLGLKTLVGPLRRWDYRAAQRPDIVLANSSHTQTKIREYYKRDSVVVHPPVDITRFQQPARSSQLAAPRQGFVTAGRQAPYKRIDLAVTACTKLNLPLTVIGNGPEHQKLKAIAGPSITFDTKASDEDVARYFCSAEAFIFPTNVEDFGVAPVEALAAGTPVIAYKAGGPLDYIIEGKTGIFFEEQTVESLIGALKKFKPKDYSVNDIKAAAEEFSVDNFHKNLRARLETALK